MKKKETQTWVKLKKLAISRSGDRAPRYDMNVRVIVESEDRYLKLECRSVNLSRSGILVVYQGHFWPNWVMGTTVFIEIDPDNHYFSEKIVTSAQVVRIMIDNEKNRNSVIFALQFED